MNYLLLGQDGARKDEFISNLKSSILSNQDAERFDYETLDANRLSNDDLKKALITLPVVAKQRLIVLRQFNKLKADGQKLLLAFLKDNIKDIVLVLDSDTLEVTATMVKKIKNDVEIVSFASGAQKINVFDVTKAMSARKLPEALKLVNTLMNQGDHPLQIMGGLSWFWNKQKARMSSEAYQKGLLNLQEADLNIKRSRLKADQAMEIVLVKLGTLLKS